MVYWRNRPYTSQLSQFVTLRGTRGHVCMSCEYGPNIGSPISDPTTLFLWGRILPNLFYLQMKRALCWSGYIEQTRLERQTREEGTPKQK